MDNLNHFTPFIVFDSPEASNRQKRGCFMKKWGNPKVVVAILFSVSLLISSCSGGGSGPNVWIDQPLDQSTFPMQSIIIQAHASDAAGVRQFEFLANDTQIAIVDVNNQRLEEASIQWTPSKPGVYTLQVQATNSNGFTGPTSSVVVTIGGGSESTPIPPVDTLPATETQTLPTAVTNTPAFPTTTIDVSPTGTPVPVITTFTPVPSPSSPPPDTTPPKINSAFVIPNAILTEGGGCPDYSRTVGVNVVATDETGVFRVSASWDIGGTEFGEIVLSAVGGDAYQGAIGPVHTVGTMVVYVSVLDAAFNITSTDAFFIDVQNCIG